MSDNLEFCQAASQPEGGRRVSAQADEADIRLLPEPDALLVLIAGIALLAALKRQRCIRPLEKGNS